MHPVTLVSTQKAARRLVLLRPAWGVPKISLNVAEDAKRAAALPQAAVLVRPKTCSPRHGFACKAC